MLSPAANPAAREISTARDLPATRDDVFRAFCDPAGLAQWWGPAGFTNTIHEFDLRPNGLWKLTMHGPDGTDYLNEWRFAEIAAPKRLVLVHERPMHRFELELTFSARGDGTRLTWRMRFDTAEETERIRPLVAAANEQNLDRLQAHLARGT